MSEDQEASTPRGPTDNGSQQVREEKSWRILFVDDDNDTLLITRMAFRNRSILGRRVEVLEAHSAAEAKQILGEYDNELAIVVTDVVMETSESGLDLIRWIRQQPHLAPTRIVVRTGQPGLAPEQQLLEELDINDYWLKAAIETNRLRTIVTGLLRSFRDLQQLRKQQHQTKRVVRQLSSMLNCSSVQRAIESLRRNIESESGSSNSMIALLEYEESMPAAELPVLFWSNDDQTQTIDQCDNLRLKQLISIENMEEIEASRSHQSLIHSGSFSWLFLAISKEHAGLLRLERSMPIDKHVRDTILLLFGSAIGIAYNKHLGDLQSKSLDEKTILLREIHHRVKNNLQVVSSLLALQSGQSNQATQSLFDETITRIHSIALIHQQLYGSEDLATIRLDQYGQELCTLLHETLTPGLAIAVDAQPVSVSIEQAMPFGLILNELVTNALKYGQDNENNRPIELSIRVVNNEIVGIVQDHGTGIPLPPEARKEGGSLGLSLVKSLTRQLRGTIEFRNTPGARVEIRFPLRAEP